MNRHRTVASFRIDSIKDQPLPSHIDGLPFTSDQLHELLVNCPSILVDPEATLESLPFSPAEQAASFDYHLEQPSTAHRRSFEVVPSELNQTWSDEYGNTYGALTFKGNNFSNPSIVEHPTASEGFIAYGLQESSIIERVLRASDLLRSRNISTEHTIGLAEPKQYPWPLIDSMTDAYETVSLKEYKRRIIDNYWSGLPDPEQTPQSLAELYQKFENMTFYISLRATDTAYRLFDMQKDAVRSKIFTQVNEQQLLPKDSESLDPTIPADMDRYLEHVFCPQIGRNFARLHTDLTHRFAHGLNMSALGSIVDLDSVHGTPLGFGDKEVTHIDRAQDIADVMSAINSIQHDRDMAISLHFINSYINETIALQPDLEAALDHLSGVFTAMFNDIRTRNSALGIKNVDATFRYINDYFYTLIEDSTPPAIIEATVNQARLHIHDTIASPEIDAVIKSQFIDNTQTYVEELIEEYTNEITSAINSGEPFSIIEALQGIYNHHSSYVGKQMIDQTVATYYSEIERRFNDRHDQPATEQSDVGVLSQTAHHIIARNALHHYHEDIRSIAIAKVGELIPLLEAPLAEANSFTVSKSLFENYPSISCTGLNKSHLWLCSDKVPLTDAIACVEWSGLPVKVEELKLHDNLNHTINVPAYTPNIVIDEITSDTFLDGWTHIEDADRPALNIHLEESPSYVLIRETINGTTQRFRLQLPVESLEQLKDGQMPLHHLLPTHEQPPLF